MKISVEELNYRFALGGGISKLEDRWRLCSRNKRGKKKRKKLSLGEMWDIFKHINIYMLCIPEGEDSEKREENLFEKIIAEIFLDLRKKKEIHIQESQRDQENQLKVAQTKRYSN